jgi:hypothetical protein
MVAGLSLTPGLHALAVLRGDIGVGQGRIGGLSLGGERRGGGNVVFQLARQRNARLRRFGCRLSRQAWEVGGEGDRVTGGGGLPKVSAFVSNEDVTTGKGLVADGALKRSIALCPPALLKPPTEGERAHEVLGGDMAVEMLLPTIA